MKTPKVYVNKKDKRRYIIQNKKRVYIDNKMSERDLIKYLIDTFVNKKKRKTKSKDKKELIRDVKEPTIRLFNNGNSDKLNDLDKQIRDLNKKLYDDTKLLKPAVDETKLLKPPENNDGYEDLDVDLGDEKTIIKVKKDKKDKIRTNYEIEEKKRIDAVNERNEAENMTKLYKQYNNNINTIKDNKFYISKIIDDVRDHYKKNLSGNWLTTSGLPGLLGIPSKTKYNFEDTIVNDYILKGNYGNINEKPIQNKFKEAKNKIDDINNRITQNIDIEKKLMINEPEEKEREVKEPEGQDGTGKLSKSKFNKNGISNTDVDKIMSKYKSKGFMGAIPRDGIKKYILSNVKPYSRLSFIINTDPEYKPGDHWLSVYIDARKRHKNTIEYYDSFGSKPIKSILRDIKLILAKLENKNKYQFKVNLIPDQDVNTTNCGFFSAFFLKNRYDGKSFKDATGYNSRGEEMIEKYKKTLPEFGHLSIADQYGAGIRDWFNKAKDIVKEGVDRIKYVFSNREQRTPRLNNLLKQYGNNKIVKVKVVRTPIDSTIKKIVNILSLGSISENQKKLNYDDVYHLFLSFELDNGKSFRLDKNSTVQMVEADYNISGESMNVNLTDITLGKLFDNIESKVNMNRIYIYNAISQNCQVFITDLLRSSGLLTSELSQFINQRADLLLKDSKYIGDISEKITGLDSILKAIIFGGQKKIKIYKKK